MADYMGMAMEQLAAIAAAENGNVGPVLDSARLWESIPLVISQGRQALSTAADRVGETWQDSSYQLAFREPVSAGEDSMQQSERIITGAGPAQALQTLSGQIGTTSKNVDNLYQQWLQLKALLEQLAAAGASAGSAAAGVGPQIRQKMEQLRIQAATQVTTLGQSYNTAGQAVTAAAQGHQWTGPSAGGPPSPGSDSDALAASPAFDVAAGGATLSAIGPGGTASDAPAFSVPAGIGGSGQDFVAASNSSAVAGVGDIPGAGGLGSVPGLGSGPGGLGVPDLPDTGAGSGDTGLAGGLATLPPVSSLPAQVSAPVLNTAVPQMTPMSPVTPFAPIGVAPVAGRGGPIGTTGSRGRGLRAPVLPTTAVGPVTSLPGRDSGDIPRAAKVGGGITAASVGKAPSLPAPVQPAAASPGATGTPPGGVMPPVSPVLGNLQALIQRLKPGTAVPSFFPGGAAGVPGVPPSLRGRVRRDEDGFFPALPVVSSRYRRDRDSDGPQTVELLDEEIWNVEQHAARPAPTPTA